MKKSLELNYEEAKLLQKAAKRLVRAAAGDVNRVAEASEKDLKIMRDSMRLSERIDALVEEEW